VSLYRGTIASKVGILEIVQSNFPGSYSLSPDGPGKARNVVSLFQGSLTSIVSTLPFGRLIPYEYLTCGRLDEMVRTKISHSLSARINFGL
jgi:hypothetical protein